MVTWLAGPQNKASFARLEYLSLYGNSLTTVEGIGVLKDSPLKQLNLGDNLLTELPEEFRLVRVRECLTTLYTCPACLPRCFLLGVIYDAALSADDQTDERTD